MAVQIEAIWKSFHYVDPPDGMMDSEFRSLLAQGDEEAWAHAINQSTTTSANAELTDWDLL